MEALFFFVGLLAGSILALACFACEDSEPDPVATYSAQSALALAHECARLDSERIAAIEERERAVEQAEVALSHRDQAIAEIDMLIQTLTESRRFLGDPKSQASQSTACTY